MKKLIYILFVSLLAFACTEPIDVDIEPGFTRLAVEAYITSDNKHQTVQLSTSGDYLIDQRTPKINNATVFVISGTDTIPYISSNDDGLYMSEVRFFGIPDSSYRLIIRDIDIDKDGLLEEYTAESKMPNPMSIDSITLGYNVDIEVWFINLYATDPPEDNWYIFKSGLNGVVSSDSISEWQLSNDELYRDNKTQGTFAQTIRQGSNNNVGLGDVVLLEVSSITKEYFQFSNNLISETFGSNPLFGGPPANVIGNISNGALGFFSTQAISRSRTVIDTIPTITNTPYGPR